MAYKTLNFDVFKLTAVDAANEIIKFETLLEDAKKMYKQLPKDGGSIVMIGKLEKVDRFWYGTLAHKQMRYLPPSVDDDGSIGVLPLKDSQGLGYWNSFLFDPELQMVVFESNQSGVNLKLFCDFFSVHHGLTSLTTEYVIDPVEMERFNNMGVFKKLELKVARIENGSIFNGKGKRQAVSQVIDAADGTNADTLSYTISTGKFGALAAAKIRSMVNGFLRFVETEEVQTMVLTGKETEEDKNDVIDFVSGRVRFSFSIVPKRYASEFGLKEKYIKMLNAYLPKRPDLLRAYKLKRKK